MRYSCPSCSYMSVPQPIATDALRAFWAQDLMLPAMQCAWLRHGSDAFGVLSIVPTVLSIAVLLETEIATRLRSGYWVRHSGAEGVIAKEIAYAPSKLRKCRSLFVVGQKGP